MFQLFFVGQIVVSLRLQGGSYRTDGELLGSGGDSWQDDPLNGSFDQFLIEVNRGQLHHPFK